MTLFMRVEKRCVICGTSNEYDVLSSSHDFDGPDLDTRPGNDYRNTMWTWLQECSCCKYVARNISKETCITADQLESTRYITCEGIGFRSNTAVKAYRYYLIKSLINDFQGSFLAMLWTTWACDDADDTENATICRKKAISIADTIVKRKDRNWGMVNLIRLDLMRRAGMFSQAKKEYSKFKFRHKKNSRIRRIIDFQLCKIKEQDTQAYRVADVFTYGTTFC